MFVLDCSVAMAWALGDEATDAALPLLERVVRTGALVPALWPLEVANVLATAVRRGRLAPEGARSIAADLEALPVDVDRRPPERAVSAMLELAMTHGISAYDAAYLELALRLEVPIATLDTALREAAGRVGPVCLPEG